MTFFTIQIIYSSKIRFVDVKNLEESQRIPSYIACLLTTMLDSWRFLKKFFEFLHLDSTNRVLKSQNFVKNLRESLKSAHNIVGFALRISSFIERILKNPRRIINKRSRPRWLCEALHSSARGKTLAAGWPMADLHRRKWGRCKVRQMAPIRLC